MRALVLMILATTYGCGRGATVSTKMAETAAIAESQGAELLELLYCPLVTKRSGAALALYAEQFGKRPASERTWERFAADMTALRCRITPVGVRPKSHAAQVVDTECKARFAFMLEPIIPMPGAYATFGSMGGDSIELIQNQDGLLGLLPGVLATSVSQQFVAIELPLGEQKYPSGARREAIGSWFRPADNGTVSVSEVGVNDAHSIFLSGASACGSCHLKPTLDANGNEQFVSFPSNPDQFHRLETFLVRPRAATAPIPIQDWVDSACGQQQTSCSDLCAFFGKVGYVPTVTSLPTRPATEPAPITVTPSSCGLLASSIDADLKGLSDAQACIAQFQYSAESTGATIRELISSQLRACDLQEVECQNTSEGASLATACQGLRQRWTDVVPRVDASLSTPAKDLCPRITTEIPQTVDVTINGQTTSVSRASCECVKDLKCEQPALRRDFPEMFADACRYFDIELPRAAIVPTVEALAVPAMDSITVGSSAVDAEIGTNEASLSAERSPP